MRLEKGVDRVVWGLDSRQRDHLTVLCLVERDISRDKGPDGLHPGGHKADSEVPGDLHRSCTGSGDPLRWGSCGVPTGVVL